METPTSPGWYDDPENPQQLRYFDGIIWTNHTTPRSAPQPPQQAQQAQPAQPQPPTAPGPPVPPGPSAYPGPQQPPTPQGWPGQYPAQEGWNAPPMGVPYRSVATTPDGQPLAGWWKRAAARIIDWIIVWFCALPLTAYFLVRAWRELQPTFDSYMRELEAGSTPATPVIDTTVLRWLVPYLVVFTLVSMAYEVAFTTHSGATPGKKLIGLKVRLREQPGPLPFQNALSRTLIPQGANMFGAVPLLSTLLGLLQVVDSLFPLLNVRKQAIHDLMARTNVVDLRRYPGGY